MFHHHHGCICTTSVSLVNSYASLILVDFRMSLIAALTECFRHFASLLVDGQFVDLLLKIGVCGDLRPGDVADGL